MSAVVAILASLFVAVSLAVGAAYVRRLFSRLFFVLAVLSATCWLWHESVYMLSGFASLSARQSLTECAALAGMLGWLSYVVRRLEGGSFDA